MVKGQLLYKNGDKYYGQLKNGQLSGQGIYKFSNGSVYEGNFENNKFNGRGKLVDQFNSITIIGNFTNGKANGSVKIIYEDQSTYEGEVRDGVREGKGKYVYAEKSLEKQYQGEFYDDHFQGQGVLTYKNNDYYKGNFKKSLFQGQGEFKSSQVHIIGQFKQGLPHGRVLLKQSNGQSYNGDMVFGQKHGIGILSSIDGNQFKGKFQNNLKEGKGEIIFPNGDIFRGEFHKDQIKQGQLIRKDWSITSQMQNNQLNGYCTISNGNEKVQITGNYNQGKKHGIFTVVKNNNDGKQITYQGEFRNGKQNPYSVSYSQRF